jgi:hypothetical protein
MMILRNFVQEFMCRRSAFSGSVGAAKTRNISHGHDMDEVLRNLRGVKIMSSRRMDLHGAMGMDMKLNCLAIY